MHPERVFQNLCDIWDPQYQRQRMRWHFHVVVYDLGCFDQLVEEFAPCGYRPEDYNRRARRKLPRGESLVLIKQLTHEQVNAEVVRVHNACERLGELLLDAVDIEYLVSPHLLPNGG